MIKFFMSGGVFMWIHLLLLALIIYLSVKKSSDLFFKANKPAAELETGINAILFWGVFNVALGFFAHYWGLYQAMLDIRAANDISPAIVAEGHAVSLITVLAGLFIFMFSAVIWSLLRWRFRIMTAA